MHTTITSAEDPRLDPFRSIKGQSRNDETFVAESEIVLARLFESNVKVLSVLITPARAERLQDLFAGYLLDESEVQVFVAPQPIINAVVGYPLHRGVIALAKRPPLPSATQLLARARTVVVLDGVMDPENVGSIFRHAAGFGVDAILLHGQTADPLYRKTIRISMGWVLGIPYARTEPGSTIAQVLAEAPGSTFFSLALTPLRTAEPLTAALATLDPNARIALLLGAEGPGLVEQSMREATLRVRIPMAAHVDSLNVSTAAAIALHALTSAHPNRLEAP
jgi:tRNA G18 (ribose-2'-O)-methylase SpoU